MENLTGGTPPVRPLPCVVPCKLYFTAEEIIDMLNFIDGAGSVNLCLGEKID